MEGFRVVRGKDWCWGDQDDGEGGVGTVIDSSGSVRTLPGTVWVLWDCGSLFNYHSGFRGYHDLYILDSAPAGIRHENEKCSFCTFVIWGDKFTCDTCKSLSLCPVCYMSDKHDTEHPFTRYEHPLCASGVKLPPRISSKKNKAKGIFKNARVTRGHNWEWNDQDGCWGNHGTVLHIAGWNKLSHRSIAKVQWDQGMTNIYRVGHSGKVDLKVVSVSNGGYYYIDHLSPLDSGPPTHVHLQRNQISKIYLGMTAYVNLLKNQRPWNPDLKKLIGQEVSFIGSNPDGTVTIEFEGMMQIVNAEWCQPIEMPSVSYPEQLAVNDDFQPLISMSTTASDLHLSNEICPSVENVAIEVRDAASINISEGPAASGGLLPQQSVYYEAPKSVDKTNCISSLERTVNAPEIIVANGGIGNEPIMHALIHESTDLNKKFESGRTLLHHAVLNKKSKIASMLLERGCDIHALDDLGQSALHLSITVQDIDSIKVLLEFECGVNSQDNLGQTALHLAIASKNAEIVDLLLENFSINPTLSDNEGFNCLHRAAQKGNHYAVQKILKKFPRVVNIAKHDGFNSLHLSCLSGCFDIVRTLVEKGQASIDVQTSKLHTPLMISVLFGYLSIVEYLVNKGADLDIVDADGRSSVWHAVHKQNCFLQVEDAHEIVEVIIALSRQHYQESPGLPLACFLVKRGAQFRETDFDKNIYKVLKSFADKTEEDCRLCWDDKASVTFKPCGHKVLCSHCCFKAKKCLKCKTMVVQRIGADSQPVEIPEKNLCPICMDAVCDIVFQCNHWACRKCSSSIDVCHICRQPVLQKIPVER